jgi:Zn-dependent protease
MVLVALAGPMANLFMALLWALIARAGMALPPDFAWVAVPLVLMGKVGIFINTILMVLNLLPLPPLDGGRVLAGLLPGPLAWRFSRIEPYGFFILLGLLFTGILWKVLGPPVSYLESVFGLLAGF